MKKITLFAIAALSLTLASCSKEQIQSEQESGRTFSMTLNASVNETKATMSDAWKFAFSTGDKISLTNNQVTAGTYYELTRGSDGSFTGTVTAPTSAADWYAYYPSHSVSLANQTGTKTGTAAYCALAGKQENVAADSKNLDISLSFQTAILVVDAQKGNIDINVKTSDGKWVSGFTAKENDATFDITKSDTKVSLLTATATGTYYVVVPAGVKIAIYDGNAKINETKDAGLTAGKYYNIIVPIKTIGDVLSTVEGGFPEDKSGGKAPVVPSNAWSRGSSGWVYKYSSALIISTQFVDGDYCYGSLTTQVTKGENCYTATISYGTLTFKMTDGILTSIEFTPDNTKPASVKYGGTYTVSTFPAGATKGVFSVSETKTVHFSRGNLWCVASKDKWYFEENQYSISSSWDANHVSNFYWSKTASVAYADSYNESGTSASDVFFTNASGFTVGGQTNVWRTLSHDEWKYLFEHHTYKYMPVNGKHGIVIAPDGFSGTIADSYSITDWATAESNGLVFLPNTGYRPGPYINETEKSCIYWTSTASGINGDDNPTAYRMFFQWNGSTLIHDFVNDGERQWAVGIRLVTE